MMVEAARPRTLPASVAPVIVGTAAGFMVAREVLWGRFLLALVVSLAVQVAVNYANDWADGVRGVDTAARVGPRRAVAAGLVAPRTMFVAMAGALAIAACAGLVLAALTAWWVLLVGLACFAAVYGYSAGPRPYASAGLGEVFVFVFFGLVATCGSTFVQLERVTLVSVVAAVPVGLLAVVILLVNNLRDIPTDAASSKRTLAVRLGEARTRALVVGVVYVVFAWPLAFVITNRTGRPLLVLAALLLAGRVLEPIEAGARGRALIPVLGATGRLQLAYAALLALGLAYP